MSKVDHIVDANKKVNAKKLPKTIHIAKYSYKKRQKVNTSTAEDYSLVGKPPLFSKASIMDDIERHSHASTCCHAIIGYRVICHE